MWRGNIGKRKRLIIFAIIVSALGLLIVFALNDRLTVRYYEVESNESNKNVRIAFVADLHSWFYGKEQRLLLRCIDDQQPDIILFGGDIVDDKLPQENAIAVLKTSAEKYPCYYVSGNHEYWSGKIGDIKKMIEGYGVIVLEGQSETIMINGQALNICGVDDAEVGADNFIQQIAEAESQTDPALFTIFMAHRPEYINTYLRHDFDLILSGHAHGGLWRLPGIVNGFYAPNQGYFPKYAGGAYEFHEKTFIVSRGLSKTTASIPRVFNPPELVIVDIVPAK